MELNKEVWTREDVEPFLQYLYSFSKGEEKACWEQRVVNTKIKCIAVPSNMVKEIVKNIKKGNFSQFIDVFFSVWDNLTLVNIIGKLICEIKSFDEFSRYLLKYAEKVDNWASCDCLKFKCNEKNKQKYLNLSKQMLNSSKPFERRIGLGVLFSNVVLFKEDIFRTLDNLYKEKEYYVNMMGAWLLAECMIKCRDDTLKYFENNSTNSFIINKGILKCRDSFRVSSADKELLLRFKK